MAKQWDYRDKNLCMHAIFAVPRVEYGKHTEDKQWRVPTMSLSPMLPLLKCSRSPVPRLRPAMSCTVGYNTILRKVRPSSCNSHMCTHSRSTASGNSNTLSRPCILRTNENESLCAKLCKRDGASHPFPAPFHSLLQIKVPQRHSLPFSFSPDGPSGLGHI